jgi:hypothetical protein
LNIARDHDSKPTAPRAGELAAVDVWTHDLEQPTNKRIGATWIEIHQDDLLADWELASAGESVFKIDPLK